MENTRISMNETWKDIKGFEGLYQISSNGRLKSCAKTWICGINSVRTKPETFMLWSSDEAAYQITSIVNNGAKKMVSQHRLMAQHFLPNPENKREVNHINGIKYDNRIENLEWATSSENRHHAYDTGLKKNKSGRFHAQSKAIIVSFKNTVRCISFPTVVSAAQYLNINESAIRNNLKGRASSHKYKFEYL